MTSSPALIVGSLAYDDLQLPSGTFNDVIGGSSSYCSLAASFLTDVRIVGVVGEDFSESFLEDLRGRGVDTDGVERVAGGKTFRWAGRYANDLASRETLDTQLNVFGDFQPKIPAHYKDTPFVLLGNIHPALQLQVLDSITSPKLVAADTMNFWISGEPKLLGDLLKRIDLLVINDEEARELSGKSNLLHAAQEIRARGPKRLVIKRGEFGSLLFDDDGVFAAPGLLLDNVVDPTGAGDSFAGGLIGTLARLGEVTPQTLRQALVVATVFGSFCVEAVGADRLRSVKREEISRRIHEVHGMLDAGKAITL